MIAWSEDARRLWRAKGTIQRPVAASGSANSVDEKKCSKSFAHKVQRLSDSQMRWPRIIVQESCASTTHTKEWGWVVDRWGNTLAHAKRLHVNCTALPSLQSAVTCRRSSWGIFEGSNLRGKVRCHLQKKQQFYSFQYSSAPVTELNNSPKPGFE